MTRKTASYHQLLKYFVKEQKGGISKTEGFILKHNITGTNVSQWAKSFELNEAARLIKRSNSVKLYHEVMSISNLDAGKISPSILHDLASKYIELRNPNAMCIAVPHFDKAHIHIHFCFSGTEIETGKSLRISKADFAQFKKELQSYQMERYPALSNSVVAHGKKQEKKDKVKDREYQLKKRTKEASERDRIKQAVDTSYAKSLSKADFMHRLSQQGLQTYSRSGRMQGIEFGYKYRFGSLGFDEKKLGELNYRDEALKGIQIFRDQKEPAKESEKEVSIEPDIPNEPDWNYKEQTKAGTDEDEDIDDNLEVEPDLDTDI
jgi:hypothetical protein